MAIAVQKAFSLRVDGLIDWYLRFAVQRERRYQLSPAGWLYKLREEIGALSARDEAQGRFVFALWGPSQVGKSTLLSTYLDLKSVGPLKARAGSSPAIGSSKNVDR